MTHQRLTRRRAGPPTRWRFPPISEGKRLITLVDHGWPQKVAPDSYAPGPNQRSRGWGSHAETFLRFNEEALRALDVRTDIASDGDGVVVNLIPGGRAGAAPLRSIVTGHVAGGVLVKPRFGWAGVGQILRLTGWRSSPYFLSLPLVPGSAREVPPWVLAGPVLSRLASLLRSMYPGYQQAEATLTKPRGRILWQPYLSTSLPRGKWGHLPCQFPDLAVDPELGRHAKWALERLHRSLLATGSSDPVAIGLAAWARHLIESLSDVNAVMPRRDELDRRMLGNRVLGEALRQGLEAIAWIVDERGLGGGNERDGVAWALPLDLLWENYVEAAYRQEAALTGGEIRVGRLGQTVFPLEWSDPVHRTLGHLVPDLVIRRGSSIQIVDAKYKAHLAEIDDRGWRQIEEEGREQHRADLHQVLAYASLYEATEITATLVYPLRLSTFISLRERRRDRSFAELFHGGRRVILELRGLPFGQPAA